MYAYRNCFILIASSYLLGSASSAILVTWMWAGKDIRRLGNRNAGAANVARSVGLLPATIVTLLDFGKGALPVLVARWLKLSDTCALAGAMAAVVGHSYPLYFRFRGGKGLAASLGALLIFTPIETLLVLPLFGLVYLVITGSAVTGALVALGLLIGLNFWRGYPLVVALAPMVLLTVMGLCAVPQIIYDWRRRSDKGELFLYWLSPKDRGPQTSRVAVITDSIASLPAEICKRENLYVVPLILTLPDGEYCDGVDIDPRQYYRLLREGQYTPKTSAPSPGEFQAIYERIAMDHDAALVITAPKELSQTWGAAHLAAEMSANSLPVTVYDSRVAGPAEGFMAIAAARLAASGVQISNILDVLELAHENFGFVVALDTLKFLAEGGRVSEAHQWMQSALHLYPVLCIINGQIRLLGMARTKRKAILRMENWLQSKLANKNVALAYCHTDALEEALALGEKMSAIFQPTESFTVELSPVIGAHTGPGLIGIAWWIKTT